MTKRGEGWISRRGQADAATAVELVLERQSQEPVQQIADTLIEDSPYQARQPISDASVSELAQGMASTGFQGVLIVRPHHDPAKRREGVFQLVYGHRRRAAWRFVCQERGERCVLPAVVREITDAQMLTIGAQENLHRQDLDPVEEAQIVAWAERMFFDKNQAEIGMLLGKSSDWVSTRSRIHKLPDDLKEALRQRPRAIKQMLELAPLHTSDPSAARALAQRVVHDSLTVDVVRQHIAVHQRAVKPSHSEGRHNRRAGATFVQEVTTDHKQVSSSSAAASTALPDEQEHIPQLRNEEASTPVNGPEHLPNPTLSTLLQEAAAALAVVAQHRVHLPRDGATIRVLDEMRRDLVIIEQVLK
jgi:ParB/RepB/Spo0J family partition protein